ncbi:hypothetical protein E2C01_064176 [Portunus trituberculatus]|uniref:Uncharacterized protein n=1 Tax=Portunus trituberculatus TaxID=210409 RepID=A0A5B7HID5_PORTR|nr:hypothetical protein [Portunus trituberculatus]
MYFPGSGAACVKDWGAPFPQPATHTLKTPGPLSCHRKMVSFFYCHKEMFLVLPVRVRLRQQRMEGGKFVKVCVYRPTSR